MRILIMGGTRFIGVRLTEILVAQGHEVVLFNRGNCAVSVEGVQQIHGDRTDPTQLKEKLQKESFDAIFDNNGRELSHTQPLVELFADKIQHFIYVSSAGVYLKSEQIKKEILTLITQEDFAQILFPLRLARVRLSTYMHQIWHQQQQQKLNMTTS